MARPSRSESLLGLLTADHIWPVNGYLLVEVEDPKPAGRIVVQGPPIFLRGRVLRTSGQYVRQKGKKPYTRKPDIPEGSRILFPSVYAFPEVAVRLYAWFPDRHLILLKTDSVLLVEEEPGGLDGVDLYAGKVETYKPSDVKMVVTPTV